MNPCLPSQDPHPDRRAQRLCEARDRYAFDWSYQGIAAVASLPLADRADPRWWAGVTEKVLQVERNALRGKVSDAAETLVERLKDGLVDHLPDLLRRHRSPAVTTPAASADPLAPWRELYHTLPAPPITQDATSDAAFGRQFLQGPNPVVLRRMTRRMDHFRVGPAELAAAVGDTDSFERALGEGRLYVADYASFDGLPAGVLDGLPKYVFAPLAAFVWSPARRALVPFAIQCTQAPGRLWTPRDGASWAMAKTVVTSADGNHQGIVSHFALCHQVMESVILATRRQLSAHHPLAVLLEPHFRDTLITNEIARTSLVGPGGNMDRLQSPTLDASLGVARGALDAFRLAEASPPEDFAARGVDDPAALGDYPARDDALPLWEAVRRWVRGYVGVYYTSAADVVGDPELAAWVTELGDPAGGRLQGLAAPTTVDAVADLVARIVYRCTGWHAQFNYTSYPLFSYAPAIQTAAFGPGPTGSDDEAAWLAMLPPPRYAAEAMGLFWQITLRLTTLGQYPDGTFADPRVAPLLEAHQADLAAVDAATAARDAARAVSWPFLRPTHVPLSIHV